MTRKVGVWMCFELSRANTFSPGLHAEDERGDAEDHTFCQDLQEVL